MVRKIPTKEVLIPISENARLRLKLFRKRIKGLVNFVNQLEICYKGKWQPVVRYNCAHGFVHRDIYSPTGKQKRKEILGKFKNLKEAVILSDKDLRNNYEDYIERFKRNKL